MKEEFLHDLCDLLKIESVLDEYNPNSLHPFGEKNNEALEFMLNLGLKNGFKVYNANGYAGHIEYGEGKEIIGILAHLDCVPAVGNWTNPPFEPVIKDNLIYARGAIDDKGPLMAAFYALKRIKEEGYKLNKRVRLIFGLDEESGSRCIEKYLELCEMPDLAFSPDADFPLINGEKGIASYDILNKYEAGDVLYLRAGDRYNIVPDLCSCKLKIDLKKEFYDYLKEFNLDGYILDDTYYIKGVAAHAMIPFKGVNAISLLVDFLKKHVKDQFIHDLDKYLTNSCFAEKLGVAIKNDKLGELTFNLAYISYDIKGLKIGINIRYPEDDYELVVLEALKNNLSNYEVIMHGVAKPLYVELDDPLVVNLLSAYREVTNDYQPPFTIGGGTYSKALKKCVAFGANMPGSEDMCHKENEYANIDDLLKASKIYELAIKKLGEI